MFLGLVAYLALSIPASLLGAGLVVGLRVGFFLASAYNLVRGLMLRGLRYRLGPTALAVPLGIQTLRISYPNIAR
ncbi:MAG TPA: hypothetical protein VLH58_13335, partial [Candidatus Methylomirabilis sp.]|nr:hypothetical protein [Candidatus Methylomirabilis sp.]